MSQDEVIKDLKAMHSYFYQFDDDRSVRHCEAIMCALTAVEKQTMKEPKVTINAKDEHPYPCIACCSPSERAACTGCPTEKAWKERYGADTY